MNYFNTIMSLKKLTKPLKRWLFLLLSKNKIPTNTIEDLQKTLKFEIGEQYEKYEFHLKFIKHIKSGIKKITYEMYLYEKEDFIELWGLPISRGIVLLYNADILEAVFYRFSGDKFDYLLSKIKSHSPSEKKILLEQSPYLQKARCEISENAILELRTNKGGNTVLCLKSLTYS